MDSSDPTSGKLPEPERRGQLKRREFMAALGVGGTVGLAGCSNDGGSGETTTPTGPRDYYGSEDATFRLPLTIPPLPPEAQFQTFAPAAPPFGRSMNYALVSRSFVDRQFYGELAADWSYDPGVLEITLHEDFYFWDGQNVDADHVLAAYTLNNYMNGGDNRDAYPYIDEAEKTGEYSVRFSLTDTFREQYALAESFTGWRLPGSLNYYQSWLEQFRGASTQQEISSIVADLSTAREETNPYPFYYGAFKLVDIKTDRYVFSLRTEDFEQLEAPEPPHYVEDINFTDVRVTDDLNGKRMTQAFINGKAPFTGISEISPDDLSFETERLDLVQSTAMGAYTFNCSQSPMSDPHFRRAWMYILDTEKHSVAKTMYPEKRVTGFLTENREQIYVSDDVLGNLTDYKWDEHAVAEAEREMEAGGFERDSEGNWLFKEGDRAGEPMQFEIISFPWIEPLWRNATAFEQAMAEFGITIEHVGDPGQIAKRIETTDFDVALTAWGGGTPARMFEINFGTETTLGTGNPEMPETWDGPPVGKPESGTRETYELAEPAQRLRVARDDEAYQQRVDRLTWVFNQAIPRAPISAGVQAWYLNVSKWDWLLPEEKSNNQRYWTSNPRRRPWTTGGVTYAPPGQQ